MASKKLSELSLDELKAQEGTLEKSRPIYFAAIFVMIIAGLFLTARKGFNTFTVVPLVFVFVYLSNRQQLKNIKKEIETREG